MEEDKHVSLLVDETEKDGQLETIMDYVISWCLRCAEENAILYNPEAEEKTIKENKPNLFRYCHSMLAKLLGLKNEDKLEFTSVKTWKQKYRIDLWVEVVLKINGEEQKHAVLIEDKYYSELRNNKYGRCQLEVYKEKFDNDYQNRPEWIKHYCLITQIDCEDTKFKEYYRQKAEENGFSLYNIRELLYSEKGEITESDIFNEYWFGKDSQKDSQKDSNSEGQ